MSLAGIIFVSVRVDAVGGSAGDGTFVWPTGTTPTPTHPNEVGILDGVGGYRLGCGGFGCCLLFRDVDPSFQFEGTQ